MLISLLWKVILLARKSNGTLVFVRLDLTVVCGILYLWNYNELAIPVFLVVHMVTWHMWFYFPILDSQQWWYFLTYGFSGTCTPVIALAHLQQYFHNHRSTFTPVVAPLHLSCNNTQDILQTSLDFISKDHAFRHIILTFLLNTRAQYRAL